ncbi:MAG TPA: type II secretion system F family protein [Solirubrobacteraceae bacterium]|jgi:type IV pilus assembly protein PilC|nr:type II secretion system F family protein [Solirubrobacteraceae bacterium]
MSDAYAFRAVDSVGVKIKGEVEADSKEAVTELLKGRGLLALEVRLKTKSAELSFDRFTRVSLEDLALMTRQLSTMISSGLSLMRAMMVLESQTSNKRLRGVVIAVRQDVESGMSFSGALSRHPKIFSELFVAMIRAGETGGFLESVLLRVADQLEAQHKLRRQVKSAMVYPAVVSSIAICVVTAMLMFIIPVFAGVFKEFNSAMPALTTHTIAASNLLRHHWYLVLVGVPALIFAFIKWKGSKPGRPVWDRMRLKAPAKIGSIVQKIALARWSRTLSSLTSAGVPMLEGIDVTGRTAGNTVVEKAMAAVHKSVQGGGTIAAALADESIFPSLVTNMVRVGEETGALDTTLSKVADFYEEQVDAAVKALTSILEPLMIVVVGGIVGFMIIAMYLPMFDVYNAIK